jgi:type II secretory pathway pseudopilin PulG
MSRRISLENSKPTHYSLRVTPVRNNEHGFTFLELLIVMSIIMIAVSILGRFMLDSLDSYRYATGQVNSSTDVLTLIDRISKVVRGTTDVVDAQTNTLTVYAYFSPNDTVVDKVRYFVSGTTLQVGVTPPTGTAPTYTYDPANEKITTLLTYLTTSPSPVFTYYDDAGNQLSGAFAVSQIKQIGIFISANPDPKHLPVNISTSTRVTLRNKKTNL